MKIHITPKAVYVIPETCWGEPAEFLYFVMAFVVRGRTPLVRCRSRLWKPFGRSTQFAPILQFGSARPYNVVNSVNGINTGGGTTNAVVVPVSNPTDYFAFAKNQQGSVNCFYLTTDCTIAKFDSQRGDPFFQLDTRLSKNFKFGERMNLQVVAQAFNLTNRANYGNNFGNSIGDAATFGHPVGFINPSATSLPRSLWGEFGVHFSF